MSEAHPDGFVRSNRRTRTIILKNKPKTRGRIKFGLLQNGKVYHRFLHTLILETFIGPRPEGHVGCHRDDNCLNNKLENLYWGTAQQNNEDKIRNGKIWRGETHPNAKLTAKDVEEIRKLYRFNYRGKNGCRDLAERYGVTKHGILMVMWGKKIWKREALTTTAEGGEG